MTRLFDATFESNSLTGTNGATATVGTVAIESAAQIKNLYSAITSTVTSYLRFDLTAVDTVYISAYVKFSAFANHRVIYFLNGTTGQAAIQIRSTGKARLLNAAGTQVGSDSTLTMTTGNVYRIGLRYTKGTGANATYEAFIAANDDAFGAAFASTSAGDGTLQITRVQVGNTASASALSIIYDDVRIDDTSMPGPSGGTNTAKPLTFTVTTARTLQRTTGKKLSVTITTSRVLRRTVGKRLLFTVATVKAITKRVGKLLTRTVTATASLVKGRGNAKPLTFTVTTSRTLRKNVGKRLAVTITTVRSLRRALAKTISFTVTTVRVIRKNIARRLNFTVTTVRTIRKTVGRALTFTVTTTKTLRKNVGKRSIITVATTRSLRRTIGKQLAFTRTIVVTLTRTRQLVRALLFTVTTVRTLRKAIGKRLTYSVTTARTLTRQIIKKLLFSTVISITRSIGNGYYRTFTFTVTTVRTLTRGRLYNRILSFTSTVSLQTTKKIMKPLFITVHGTPQIRKQLSHLVSIGVSTLVTVLKGKQYQIIIGILVHSVVSNVQDVIRYVVGNVFFSKNRRIIRVRTKQSGVLPISEDTNTLTMEGKNSATIQIRDINDDNSN